MKKKDTNHPKASVNFTPCFGVACLTIRTVMQNFMPDDFNFGTIAPLKYNKISTVTKILQCET